MDKEQYGRLIRHFVALRVAEQLITSWNQHDRPIEYIDCYSMGPWEDLCHEPAAGYELLIDRLSRCDTDGTDSVARAFWHAWEDRYRRRNVHARVARRPEVPQDVSSRQFPNTAILLTAAFPKQRFKMRLHDAEWTNRQQLVQWAKEQGPGSVRVAGDWTQSALLYERAAPLDRPSLIILDPCLIVTDDHMQANEDGILREGLIRYLVGADSLAIHPAVDQSRTAPCVVILMSYRVKFPADDPDPIVQKVFQNGGWSIERLAVGPIPDLRFEKRHLVWVVSRDIPAPILGCSLDDAWKEWFSDDHCH